MERREILRFLALGTTASVLLPNISLAEDSQEIDFKAADFGKDFLWGVATAAYQIEGGRKEEGKGESIWDHFVDKKGNIKNGDKGDVSCDFFHHYEEDIRLLKSLNMQVLRLSIAWSRVLPNGIGEVNKKGLEFYHKVIDTCLENDIQPWITLYHWDLPQALQEKGGWENRDVIKWFSEYTELVSKEYGSKVKNWMVLNEPASSTALGYLLGYHAPGKMGLRHFLPAVHHTTMCQAEGGRILRKNIPDAQIGTTFSCSYVDAWKSLKHDKKAMERWDVMLNRLFIEPAVGMGYPFESLPFLKKMKRYIHEGDLEKLKFDFDFIGVQNYTREVVRKSALIPLMKGYEVRPKKRGVKEITEMGWEVYPEGIYHMVKRFAAYPNVKKVIVTENGCSFPDEWKNNEVRDFKRVDYYQRYLKQVLRAKQEGVNVGGYFCWTLLDNFEWSEGFRPRFGIVYVDFKTQQRTIKESGLWFREFLGEK